MKRIFLSALLISIFYQISNAKEAVVKDKGDNVSTEEKSVVKTKETDKTSKKEDDTKSSKEELKDSAQKATKDVEKIKKTQDEVKKSHKGRFTSMQRGHMGIFIKPSSDKDKRDIYAVEVTYEFGLGYFITDRIRLEALVGPGFQGFISTSPEDSATSYKSTSSSSYSLFSGANGGGGIFIPIEIVASYSVTNFVNWDKDIEVFASIGYDFNVYGNSMNKFNLSAGLQLGRYMGLRLTYAPYAKYKAPETQVSGITFKAKDPESFYLLGLSLSYRL